MFGFRNTSIVTRPATASTGSTFCADLKRWHFEGIGGEEALQQKQTIGGPVRGGIRGGHAAPL